MKSNRFELITSSQLVYGKGLLLKGFVMTSDDPKGSMTLYDGQDSASGRRIGTFYASEYVSIPISFDEGLRLERGLYVAFGSHMIEVLFYFNPWEIEPETEE